MNVFGPLGLALLLSAVLACGCAHYRVKRDLMNDCMQNGRSEADCKAQNFKW